MKRILLIEQSQRNQICLEINILVVYSCVYDRIILISSYNDNWSFVYNNTNKCNIYYNVNKYINLILLYDDN